MDVNLHEPMRELARPGDIAKSCLVVEKASVGLGWKPETSLTEGIKDRYLEDEGRVVG